MTLMSSIGAVLLSALVLYLGNGLQNTLLPVAGAANGFPTLILGLLGSAYAAGFMAGCLAGPLVIRRVGHIRSFAVLAAVLAITVLGYVIVVDPWAWLAFRAIAGMALAGLFMVVESWLNASADNRNRGRVLSLYLVLNSGGLMLGQLGVALADPTGATLFALAAVAACLAILPVGLTSATGPAPVEAVRLRLGRLFRLSPLALCGAALLGMTNGAFATLAPVFMLGRGFDSLTAAAFLSAAMLGGMLAQFPAGWVSDRVDRRYVIIVQGVVASGLALALWASTGEGPVAALIAALGLAAESVWIALGFCLGTMAYPLYGVIAAHMNDHVEPGGFVEASGGLLIVWGLGAVLGPIAAAAAMERLAGNALFLWMAFGYAALALYGAWRVSRRAAPGAKDAFAPASIIRPTPAAMALDPRAPDMAEPPEPPEDPAKAGDAPAAARPAAQAP